MIGIVALLTCLALPGAAVGWRLSNRPAHALRAPRLPVSMDGGEDLLPWSAGGERVDGLAAFYAYQMATSRIDRSA